jgi:beta-N-acetylhexosaminidase
MLLKVGKMFKFFVLILLFSLSLLASIPLSLDKSLGEMLMVGFYGTEVSSKSQICKDIKNYNLAGVILFDYNPVDRKKAKNISSKKQLKRLTTQLQNCSKNRKLLIAVDQEGGLVQRLKKRYGFKGNFPKASNVSTISDREVENIYNGMAKELNSVGINYNLAPVVDLSINKKNRVIYKLGRSFGENPRDVAHYSSIFIKSMHSYNILTSLKHFPGHGSSTGDTHKGFVDVTKKWKAIELIPYKLLIDNKNIDSIMVAHIMNKKLDSLYPATLSSKIINGKLRGELGFNGVVITDDLQMGAISQRYKLRDTIKLSINAGDDILLFGNQLDPRHTVKVKELIDIMKSLLQSKEITIRNVKESNRRVENLKRKL